MVGAGRAGEPLFAGVRVQVPLQLVGLRVPQNNQLHTKSHSSVYHRRCAFSCDVLPYSLPQLGMWQLCRFFLRRCAQAGPSRSASWQLGQSHTARPVYRRYDCSDGR